MLISGWALRRKGSGSISPSSVNVQLSVMRTSSFIVGGKVGTALGENVRVGDIDGKKEGAKLIVGSSVGGCVTVGAGVVGAAVSPGLPREYDGRAVGS